MTGQAKKLTTAAVCTALAVIMCVMTAYLPLSFMPLYLAAFCIFSACKRSGLMYGALTAIAAAGLMFLITGLSVKWLLFVVMFAPYGIAAFFADRFTYFKVKTALLRALVAIVYFNVTFGAVYAITVNVASVGREVINVAEWVELVGGYPILALIATAVLVPLDFIFSAMSRVVLRRIPGFTESKKPPLGDGNADKPKADDVFGYEITDDPDPPRERDGSDDTHAAE